MNQNIFLSTARNKFDAVLIDLDGTIADSIIDVTNALNATLQLEALAPFTVVEVQSMFGDGALTLLKRALRFHGVNEYRATELISTYFEHYELNALKTTRVYPGVIETLEYMANAGFSLAVVTNKPTQAANLLIEYLKVEPFIKIIVGGDTVESLKPAPTLLQAALDYLGIEASRAVMVGDMVHDVVAGRAASVATISVTYGYDQQLAREIVADITIDSFTDLPGALYKLSSIQNTTKIDCNLQKINS